MKQTYDTPQVRLILVADEDIVRTSLGDVSVKEPGEFWSDDSEVQNLKELI